MMRRWIVALLLLMLVGAIGSGRWVSTAGINVPPSNVGYVTLPANIPIPDADCAGGLGDVAASDPACLDPEACPNGATAAADTTDEPPSGEYERRRYVEGDEVPSDEGQTGCDAGQGDEEQPGDGGGSGRAAERDRSNTSQ